MNRLRPPVRLAALLGSLTLGGCVSLLPRQPPVQLYQFGRTDALTAVQTPGFVGPGQGALGVLLAQVSFPRAAQGDGVLTTRGEEAAYVAGARWLAPAVLLFQEDAEQAFAARARRVRLVARSDLGAASALLRLDVGEFDARYNPAGGAPTVVVSLRATLARTDGGRLVQQGFSVRRAASEDRAPALVAAYDLAVQEVLAEVVGWTEAQTPALVADPPAPSAASSAAPPS